MFIFSKDPKIKQIKNLPSIAPMLKTEKINIF
jgi:hypothetical protein